MRKFTWVVIVFVIASVVALTLAQPSHGQYCNRVYHAPTYYNPVYTPVKEVIVKEVITPIAIPVIVPAFSFQYVPPAFAAQPPPGVVPGVTPQAMNGYQNGYQNGQQAVGAASQSVTGQQPLAGGQPIGARAGDDSVKLLARALLEEIRRQNGQGQTDDGPPVALSEPGSGLPPPGAAPVIHNGLLSLTNNCASCHTGPQAKGGVRIFDSPGVVNPLAPRDKILDAIQSGRMPPPGNPPLQAADREAIRNWSSGR